MAIARHVRVTGRVQGVFFRAWTKQQADRLRVGGWVRNCPDSSVEAHLEGEQAAIDQLIGMLRRGPPAAKVEGVAVKEAEVSGIEGFKIRD